MKIILGSQSPRRRELLSGLDIPFETVNIDANESYPITLQASDIPLYVARAKAKAYSSRLNPEELLITADTTVWINQQTLGKPHSEQEAFDMLQLLSGKTHQVFTAVTFNQIIDGQFTERCAFVDQTDVTFRALTSEEIRYYIAHYRPFDKAGAYGVQEYIGYIGVSHLNGSFYNVMGFPIARVYQTLNALGAIPQFAQH